MTDDELWKNRFQLFVLVRLFGLAIVALGIAIAYTDLLRDNGWPLVGFIVAVAGAIDAIFAPRMLKKAWEMQDVERQGPDR
ncbi:MAG TPA: hypothetical protein VNA29_09790 [Sphingomicrobium sp.]|nr:hypothetical protein [Sphingomicrobium sp.]